MLFCDEIRMGYPRMKVFGTGVDTDPHRGRFALRGGDVVNPLDGNQLNPPWPTKVSRWYCRWPILPWLCIRLPGKAGKRKGMYVGFKVFGFNLPSLLNWPGITEADVTPDGLALQPTIRFFTDG